MNGPFLQLSSQKWFFAQERTLFRVISQQCLVLSKAVSVLFSGAQAKSNLKHGVVYNLHALPPHTLPQHLTSMTVYLQHSMLLHTTPGPSQKEITVLYAAHSPQYGTTKQFKLCTVLSGQGIAPMCVPTMFRSGENWEIRYFYLVSFFLCSLGFNLGVMLS